MNNYKLTPKDIFLERKNNLDNAYKMALILMKKKYKSEWDIRAFAWCLVDLINRDFIDAEHKQNINVYLKQFRELNLNKDKYLMSAKEYIFHMIDGELYKARNLYQRQLFEEAFLQYKNYLELKQVRNKKIKHQAAWSAIHFIMTKYKTTLFNPNIKIAVEFLKRLEIDSKNKQLMEQLSIAINVGRDEYYLEIKAIEFISSGNIQGGINIYNFILNRIRNDEDIKTVLGWLIYCRIRQLLLDEIVDAKEIHQLIQQYMSLNLIAPSILHSKIMLAANIFYESTVIKEIYYFSFAEFSRNWNLSLFIQEDFYFDFEETFAQIPLVYRTLNNALEDAVQQENISCIKYIIPFINKYSEKIKSTNKLFAINNEYDFKCNQIKALILISEYKQALPLAIKALSIYPQKYLLWENIALIFLEIDKKLSFSCFCKTFSLEVSISQTWKSRIKFIELLIEMKKYKNAKIEINKILDFKGYRHKDIHQEIDKFKKEFWFQNIRIDSKDNQLFYLANLDRANNIIVNWLS